MKNKVYLVGAGPGKPDLITVRGLNILKEAEVVIYDYLVDKRILENASPGAKLICCDRLGKKRYSDAFLVHQDKINNLLVKKAKEGKKVVRLKNGDVSIFSRLSQELEALVKNKIDYELVPGVTVASAASCFAGIPLTDRRFASTCVFVTGHEDPQKKASNIDWQALSKAGTIVFYMAVENLSKIAKELIRAGKAKGTACAIVQDATLPTQKVLTGTLADIVKRAKKEKIRPPAIVIVGDIVKLGKQFNWLEKSKRILFTGLSKERFFLKGAYFHLPLIKIEPMPDYRQFDSYLKNIASYDWIVFASRYGVEYFFQRLNKIGADARGISNVRVAVIGNSTRSRLLDFGIVADLVAKDESSVGLLKEFKKTCLRDKKIFLPRSNLSDKGLSKGLKSQGAEVISCIAYRNVMPKDLPDLDLGFFDEVMFTSPSGARNFVKRYGKLPKGIKISYIGDVTLKELKLWHLI